MSNYNYYQNKQEYLDDLKEHLKSVSFFKEIRSETWGLSIRRNFSMIGSLSLFSGDVITARRYYSKAARFTTEIFKIFEENRYPNLFKSEKLPFTALFRTSLIDAILCGDKELLKDFVDTIQDFGDVAPPFNYEITYAIKYLLQGQLDKAKEHAAKAHQEKYFKLPYKGFSHAILGILAKDVELTNEGILYRLNYHMREEKNSIFFNTSFESTALAKLAIMHGVNVDVSNSFIHKDLLLVDGKVSDSGIDEILEALAIANKRNSGGLMNKIGRWLN